MPRTDKEEGRTLARIDAAKRALAPIEAKGEGSKVEEAISRLLMRSPLKPTVDPEGVSGAELRGRDKAFKWQMRAPWAQGPGVYLTGEWSF